MAQMVSSITCVLNPHLYCVIGNELSFSSLCYIGY